MIFDKELWALTPEATQAVDAMMSKGMDRDLAVAFLETVCGEAAIYSLDEEEEGSVL